MGKIKLLVMDVDGTLTDGKIYMGNDGEVFKAFNIKDGCAIHDILPKIDVDWKEYNTQNENEVVCGIVPCIITARKSDIVEQRCRELQIKNIYQGYRDKTEALDKLTEKFGIEKNELGIYEEVAYVGDDIIDIPIMKECGLIAAPADAAEEVLAIADFVSEKPGGEGAVREFVERILKKS